MRSLLRGAVLAAALAAFHPVMAASVIIQMKDPGMIAMVARSYGIASWSRAGSSPFFQVIPKPGVDLHALEVALAGNPWVLEAEADKEVGVPEHQSSRGTTIGAVFDSAVAYQANQTLWSQIGFAGAPVWAGQTVGIVDTGLSDRQPVLWQKVSASASFVPGSATALDLPKNLDTNLNGIKDEGAGHGTMVAGLIAQMSPFSRLVVAKAADADGVATTWSCIQGVVFAVERKATIVNFSLGSVSEIVMFSDVLDWLKTRNISFVAAAGNASLSRAIYPARLSKSICVTGVMPDNTKASFSCWDGSALAAAPATGVTSAWWDGGTAVWSGTSFAAPLVSGAAAAALPATRAMNPDKLKYGLTATGKNIDSLNPAYAGKLGRLINAAQLGSYLRAAIP